MANMSVQAALIGANIIKDPAGVPSYTPRVIISDCQTPGVSVSGAITDVRALPAEALATKPKNIAATQCLYIEAAAGDTYAEVRLNNIAQPFKPSDQGVIGMLVYWPNAQTGGLGLVMSSDNFGTKNIRQLRTGGSGFRTDDGWVILLFSAAEDGTTAPNGETWTAAGGMALTEDVNAIGVQIASGGGKFWIADIFRVPGGTLSKATMQIGFDSFNTAPTSLSVTASNILTSANMRGYWAGDANLIRDVATSRNPVMTWLAAGHDIISQGMWHANQGQYAQYNPAGGTRYVGDGYALNPGVLADDAAQARAIFRAFQIDRTINLFSLPYSAGSVTTDAILKQSGVVLCRGANSFAPSLIPSEFSPALRPVAHTGFNVGGNTLAKAKKYVDACVRYGVSGNLYCHGLTAVSDPADGSAPADPLYWYVSNFQALVTYIKSYVDQGKLDVLTPSQWATRYLG